MTAAVVAIVALSLVVAGLVAWIWHSARVRRRERDEAARALDRAKAAEQTAVDEARADEAATVERVEADRDAALQLPRDERVAEALRRARARYGQPDE